MTDLNPFLIGATATAAAGAAWWLFRAARASVPKPGFEATIAGQKKHYTSRYNAKNGGYIVISINLEAAREDGHAITAISYHMSDKEREKYTPEEHMEAIHTVNRAIADEHNLRLFHVFIWKDDAGIHEIPVKYRPRKKPLIMKMREEEAKKSSLHSPNQGTNGGRIIRPQ